MANIDLDVLFPENELISFTGNCDKKRYEIDLFIPSIVFSILDNKDLSSDEQQTKIIEIFLRRKYQHMTTEWINKNISAPRQNAIATQIIAKLNTDKELVG